MAIETAKPSAVSPIVAMAIVDDYAAIAAELRRLQAERRRLDPSGPADRQSAEPPLATRHPMRATPAGDLLYRRLVFRGRR
jgi:hypothetical protein